VKYVGENLYNSPHLNKEAAGSYSIQLAPREYVSVHTAVPCSVFPKDIKRSTSQLDEKGLEMVFRCMQPLWVATPACRNGSTTGITGYLPMLPPKGLPTARPTGNLPRTVTWEMTEGKSMEILENFWFFAIFQPKSLGRFGKIWTD